VTETGERHGEAAGDVDDVRDDATDYGRRPRLGWWPTLRTPGRRGLALLALLGVALALRFVPLSWSPHPATLDGFGYAWRAREALATGAYPLSAFRVDSFVFTGLLAALGAVLGVPPLRLTQPAASLIGTAGVLAALVLARRVVAGYGWSPRRRTLAVLVVGVLLAVDGIFLRRTMVADEEVFAYVLLPILVLSLHLWLRGAGRRWLAVALLPLVAFPVLHVLSTLVALLSVLGLVAAHAAHNPGRRTVLGGGAVAAGFWLYVGAYYSIAAQSVMTVPYVDRVTAYPGVFLAWVVVLVLGAAWLQVASTRAKRLAFLAPVAAFYLVATANAVVAVFPATAQTPPVLLVPLFALSVPAVFAGLGVGSLSPERPNGALVVALLLAPIALVGFSLTASLTPEYFGTVTRSQTFLHAPGAIVAALGLVGLVAAAADGEAADRDATASGATDRDATASGATDRLDSAPDAVRSAAPTASTALRLLVVLLVVAATAGSVPLAYLNLDTASYPSTTLNSEFEAVEFAATHVPGGWATDHSLSRVAIHYFRDGVAISPAAQWLRGGPPPACPVLSQESWTTTGAHLFPGGPGTVSPAAYDRWLGTRTVVYANAGRDPVTVSRPPARAPSSGC